MEPVTILHLEIHLDFACLHVSIFSGVLGQINVLALLFFYYIIYLHWLHFLHDNIWYGNVCYHHKVINEMIKIL